MSRPFRRRGGAIRISLTEQEREVLATLPDALANLDPGLGDAAAVARLNPAAYPDDPDADADFREMTADDLARARGADRSLFLETMGSGEMSEDDAQAWLRVIGDARLTLAARMGIEHEQWEEDRSLAESREGALLHYLSYLQDALIQVLSAGL